MFYLSPGMCRRIALSALPLLGGLLFGCSGQNDSSQMNLSGKEINFSESSRDLEPPSALAPALQRLASGSEASRDLASPDGKSRDAPSPSEVGYSAPGTSDLFQVAIHITPEADLKAIAAAGAHVQTRLGNILYATVHARNLQQLGEVDGVLRVAPMPGNTFPKPPKIPLETAPRGESARELQAGSGDAANFEHHNQSGKGVIVGIVDTGIDWRHQDFMNPDGSTRIVQLWDIFDDSWEKSNHTIGTKPPMNWDDTGKPIGTIYTQDQINAAIKGQLKIPRTDKVGHGTACAGTAAGNVLGVAPLADLVIVNTYRDDPKNPENDGAGGVFGAQWITQVAAERHQPCVISLSFGGHASSHDGMGEEESGFNELVKHGEAPGVVVCASAGNNGQDSMHARGRFGPARPDELHGGIGGSVELFVREPAVLFSLFDSRDDWKFYIRGMDKFLLGPDQKPAQLYISKNPQKAKSGNGLHISASDNLQKPDQDQINSLIHDKKIDLESLPGGNDLLVVSLPPGRYFVAAAGNSEQVTRGVYDLYLPEVSTGSFGSGGDYKMLVGQPGDADDVITVGSYDFRNEWENVDGGTTHSGTLDLGNISAYSSPGFRRDGVVKPDIAAPGQYTISALAVGCMMGQDAGAPAITRDGKHIAWAGTSASCPYTAGVVALMLEKNPQLTLNQVKQILRDTADHDFAVTGAVPNAEWGYGKLNPEKALAKVPQGAALPLPAAPTSGPATAPTTEPVVTPPVQAGFAGVFKGDGVTLDLIPNPNGSFSGTMLKKDQTFTLDARVVASQLEGTVHSGGKDFPFNATLDGDKLTLHAGEKTFNLTRQDAPRGVGEDWLQRSISPEAGDEASARDLGGGLTLRPTEIRDPMIYNWPAYTLLLPEGWSFKGAIHWNQDPYTMVSPTFVAHAPGGLPGLLLYPQGSYVAGIREQRMEMFAGVGGSDFMAEAFAEGKLYQGKEIRVFATPAEYIKRFVIPMYRKELANAGAAGVEDAPKYARMIGDASAWSSQEGTRVDAVRVRFQYDLKGQPVDEDMYCAVTAIPMPGNLVCWITDVISFAAPRGTMQQSMPLLATMIASARPQLKWVNACMQVSQMMQQNIASAIAQEGMLSRYIAKTSDEISDIIRSSYEDRIKVEERAAKEFDDYIRGVNTYQGPNGPVQLPNNGNPWYVDPSGGYHQSQPGQDPDSGWQPLKPVQG